MAESTNTRRGSNLSASPLAATASARTTEPSCTPLDSTACRVALIPDSRTMSGRIAAEANHKLIPAISARTRRVMDVRLDDGINAASAFMAHYPSWSDLVRPSTSSYGPVRAAAGKLVDGRAKHDHDGRDGGWPVCP